MTTYFLIPTPENAIFLSDALFKLSPTTLTADEFDTYWSLVSTVYTKIGGVLKQQNGDVEVQKYECRSRKQDRKQTTASQGRSQKAIRHNSSTTWTLSGSDQDYAYRCRTSSRHDRAYGRRTASTRLAEPSKATSIGLTKHDGGSGGVARKEELLL